MQGHQAFSRVSWTQLCVPDTRRRRDGGNERDGPVTEVEVWMLGQRTTRDVAPGLILLGKCTSADMHDI